MRTINSHQGEVHQKHLKLNKHIFRDGIIWLKMRKTITLQPTLQKWKASKDFISKWEFLDKCLKVAQVEFNYRFMQNKTKGISVSTVATGNMFKRKKRRRWFKRIEIWSYSKRSLKRIYFYRALFVDLCPTTYLFAATTTKKIYKFFFLTN